MSGASSWPIPAPPTRTSLRAPGRARPRSHPHGPDDRITESVSKVALLAAALKLASLPRPAPQSQRLLGSSRSARMSPPRPFGPLDDPPKRPRRAAPPPEASLAVASAFRPCHQPGAVVEGPRAEERDVAERAVARHDRRRVPSLRASRSRAPESLEQLFAGRVGRQRAATWPGGRVGSRGRGGPRLASIPGSSRRAGRSPLHHGAPILGEDGHRRSVPLKMTQPAVTQRRSRRSNHPSGCPGGCRRSAPREPRPLKTRVVVAVDHFTAVCNPKRPWTRATPESALRTQSRRLRVNGRARSGQCPAHVAAAAAVEGLGLIAEVAENGIVAAASPLDPPDQLEEETPLVLEHRRSRGGRPRFARARRGGAAGRAGSRAGGRSASSPSRPARPPPGSRPRPTRRAQMDDGANVGPVDPHAEGVGGHEISVRPSAKARCACSRAAAASPA